MDEEIARAIDVLEKALSDSDQPSAVVIQPPDSGEFILGNRGGFVHLAITSLKAALGKAQSFENESWLVIEDLDWGIKGLKPDESAHIYLQAKLTRTQRIRRSIFGFLIVFLAALFLIVGSITIVRWIIHLI